MYWAEHVDIEFELTIGMKISRYFGDDLYNGEVRETDGDGHKVVYEDGDTETMDSEQIQYAHELYYEMNI